MNLLSLLWHIVSFLVFSKSLHCKRILSIVFLSLLSLLSQLFIFHFVSFSSLCFSQLASFKEVALPGDRWQHCVLPVRAVWMPDGLHDKGGRGDQQESERSA